MGGVPDEVAPTPQSSFSPTAPSARTLVYGLGRSGRCVAQFLARAGAQQPQGAKGTTEWMDAAPTAEDRALMDELGLPEGDISRPYTLVIAAPGVPIDHPDLQRLRAGGAEIIGEVALAARAFPNTFLVGVTGTAGKGGTTTLTAQLLRAAGINAKEGGNIDPPLLEVAGQCEVAVVELSSFQLERTADTHFPVAVITNLGTDHLDRHGSLEQYHAAKLNVLARQRAGHLAFYRPEDADKVLPAAGGGGRRSFDAAHIALSDGTPVIAPQDVPRGLHPANAAAAVLAAEATLWRLGRIQPQHTKANKPNKQGGWNKSLARTFKNALLSAKPTAGRFEEIAVYTLPNGKGCVRFVEDSIATRTIAAQSALTLAQGRVVWIVGGRDKGAEMDLLRGAARERVAHLVAFGESGPHFAGALAGVLGITATTFPYHQGLDGRQAMQEVVNAAAQAAQAEAEAHGEATVLLAPLGTSFDLYANYRERGAAFRSAVQTWLEGQGQRA